MAEIDIENPGADAAALSAAIRALSFEGLPTIDPNNVGSLWIDGGVVCVSNGDPADWLPAGAFLHIDTTNNRYYGRGAKRVRSEILALAGGAVLTAQGAGYPAVDQSASVAANLIGAALLDLISVAPLFTMLVTARINSDAVGRGSLIAVGANNLNVHFERDAASTYMSVYDSGGGGASFTDANLNAASKIAVSIDSGLGQYRASANGAAVQPFSFGDPMAFLDGSVELRFGTPTSARIQTVTAWALMDDADLPALST